MRNNKYFNISPNIITEKPLIFFNFFVFEKTIRTLYLDQSRKPNKIDVSVKNISIPVDLFWSKLVYLVTKSTKINIIKTNQETRINSYIAGCYEKTQNRQVNVETCFQTIEIDTTSLKLGYIKNDGHCCVTHLFLNKKWLVSCTYIFKKIIKTSSIMVEIINII